MIAGGLWAEALSRATELVDQLRTGTNPDHLKALIGFSDTARQLDPTDMTNLEWDRVYGSNLAGALDRAREALFDEPGVVVVFTDLGPTAHYDDRGEPFFRVPASAETIRKTLEAIGRYDRSELRLDVFRFFAGETPREGEAAVLIRAILDVGGSVKDIRVPGS